MRANIKPGEGFIIYAFFVFSAVEQLFEQFHSLVIAHFPGFITVRTSSTRLPNKCLLPFGEGNVLQHVIRRARASDIEPIVCTSVDASDNVIEQISASESVRCFRGSLTNKLKRWSDCAAHVGVQHFHTVDADDPFFDGDEMKRSMKLLIDGGFDMVCPTVTSSGGAASVGYSLTSEIVKRATAGLADDCDTEMMWYYVEKLPGLRRTILPDQKPARNSIRLTLDYPEDYWLLESLRRIVGNLAKRSEVEAVFERNPDFYKINWFRNEEFKAAQLAKRV